MLWNKASRRWRWRAIVPHRSLDRRLRRHTVDPDGLLLVLGPPTPGSGPCWVGLLVADVLTMLGGLIAGLQARDAVAWLWFGYGSVAFVVVLALPLIGLSRAAIDAHLTTPGPSQCAASPVRGMSSSSVIAYYCWCLNKKRRGRGQHQWAGGQVTPNQ